MKRQCSLAIIPAPQPIERASPLANIDGQVVNVSGIENTIYAVLKKLSQRNSFVVFTLNLDHLVKRRRIPQMREAYGRADIVTADGFPIVVLSRLTGVDIERAAGSDLVAPVCRAASERQLPVFFLGTTFPALCASARRLVASYPDLEISGVYAPPIGFDVDSETATEAIRMIRESGARLCFVALGAPLQEMFAVRASDETSGIAFLAVGASLDYLAGTQTRCPQPLRKMNLEWAWRLMSDPRRLWLRYVRCGILFAKLLIKTLSIAGKERIRNSG